MNPSEALQILTGFGAIITDSHFVYTSDLHGTKYINKDGLYPHTAYVSLFCRAIAEKFVDDNVQVVIAPAVGGVILSTWTALHLSNLMKREVLSVYADKEGKDGFVIKRGYEKLLPRKRVLVVEDLLTTGKSVARVVDAARRLDAEIVGVGVIANRGNVTAEKLGNTPKLVALTEIQMEAITEEKCRAYGACSRGVPVDTSVGHGREFLARASATKT